MEIVLIGPNDQTASVQLRERVSFDSGQARRAAEELRSHEMQGELEDIEAMRTLFGLDKEQ